LGLGLGLGLSFGVGVGVANAEALGCVAWRQTGDCDPQGPREPHSDKDCGIPVAPGASGYCECAGGERMGLAGCDHAEFTCGAACERRLEEAPAAGIRPEGTCRGSKICDCSRAGHSCVCGAPGAGQNGCCNMGCGGCEAACDGAPPPPARPGGAAEQRLEAAPPVGYEPAPLEAATDCAAHLSCGKCVAGGCAWCVADRVCRDDKPWQCQGTPPLPTKHTRARAAGSEYLKNSHP